MYGKASGMCVSCAKRSGSGGRGRRALSWQATEAFSWANLEGRHEKSTALHESRATNNHVVLCSLHCTLRYIYGQTPLALHKQGSQRGECKCVRTSKNVTLSSVVRGTEKETDSELKRRKQMIGGIDWLRFIRTGVLRLNLSFTNIVLAKLRCGKMVTATETSEVWAVKHSSKA